MCCAMFSTGVGSKHFVWVQEQQSISFTPKVKHVLSERDGRFVAISFALLKCLAGNAQGRWVLKDKTTENIAKILNGKN